MRGWLLLIQLIFAPSAWAGSTYSLPIPKPDTRPISLANETPLGLSQLPVSVVGEFGGHVYHTGSVPLLKRSETGRLDLTDETIAVGSTVKILAFVRFRGSYYYRLESQANSGEARFVDGRFLIVPSQATQTNSASKSP